MTDKEHSDQTDGTYLVHVDRVVDRESLLGALVMHIIGDLGSEDADRLLAPSQARKGMVDIRIVIEGQAFPFAWADGRLTEAWDRSINEATREFINSKIDELQTRVRDAVAPVIAEFGIPPDEDEP
jgi:hypothetical protein